jgi:hypothetical protein
LARADEVRRSHAPYSIGTSGTALIEFLSGNRPLFFSQLSRYVIFDKLHTRFIQTSPRNPAGPARSTAIKRDCDNLWQIHCVRDLNASAAIR